MDKKTEQLIKLYESYKQFIIRKYNVSVGKEPFETDNDHHVIQKIIELKTFVVIPNIENNKIVSLYTVGCWYYWNIPELYLYFDEPLQVNIHIVNTIVGTIHNALVNFINNSIDKTVEKTFDLELPEYQLSLTLEYVPIDNVLEINAPYTLWFNTYWGCVDLENKVDDPQYPTYKIKMNEQQITNVIDYVADSILENETEYDSDDSLERTFHVSFDAFDECEVPE